MAEVDEVSSLKLHGDGGSVPNVVERDGGPGRKLALFDFDETLAVTEVRGVEDYSVKSFAHEVFGGRERVARLRRWVTSKSHPLQFCSKLASSVLEKMQYDSSAV